MQSKVIVGQNKMLNKRAPFLQESVRWDRSQTNNFQGRLCLKKQANMDIQSWDSHIQGRWVCLIYVFKALLQAHGSDAPIKLTPCIFQMS